MKGKKAIDRKASAKELDQSIHLIKAPGALEQDPSLTLPKKQISVPEPMLEEAN